METWQLWNGKLKMEMHYWKQDRYDTPIYKPYNVGNLPNFVVIGSNCKCIGGTRQIWNSKNANLKFLMGTL